MNKIKAIIIDDEPGCVSNLLYHLAVCCPDIDVVATGHSIQDALTIHKQSDFDLAFLDIEVFDENIFDMLNAAGPISYKIVFVTAYDRYAVRAFKVDAVDYLLKPLLESDIRDCYTRIRKCFGATADQLPEQSGPSTKSSRKIILKQSDKVYVIRTEDICYLEARGFYTRVIFVHGKETKKLIVSKPISQLAREYADDHFFRVHKSYLINTRKISDIVKQNGLSIRLSDNELIPVAKRRATEFLAYLNDRSC